MSGTALLIVLSRIRIRLLFRYVLSTRLRAGLLLLTGGLLQPTLHAAAQAAKPMGGAERGTWFMYFGDHPYTEHWGVHLEGQYRRQGLGQRWEQLLIRPGIDYKLSHGFSTLLAYTYLRSYPFEGGSLGYLTTTGPQPEHRILEELKYTHRLLGEGEKAVKLSHRFRAEQRWQGTSTAGAGTSDWEFAERARYRLTADVPFRWKTMGARPDYASVYDEIFVNFGPHGENNALDRNRTYGAVGWDLNKDWQVEVGYLYQYQPVPNGIVGEQSHALQITITSTAPFRRGLKKSD